MDKADQKKREPTSQSSIPRFKTVEEAANYWDNHSLASEEDLEPVNDVKFVVMRSRANKPITVRLPEDTLASLTEKAHEMGVGPSTLIRMWVIEQLSVDRKTPSGTRG